MRMPGVRALEKMVLVTQWGWVRNDIHRRGQDIAMPAMLKVDKLIKESPFMGMAAADGGVTYANASYQYLLSFVGSVRGSALLWGVGVWVHAVSLP